MSKHKLQYYWKCYTDGNLSVSELFDTYQEAYNSLILHHCQPAITEQKHPDTTCFGQVNFFIYRVGKRARIYAVPSTKHDTVVTGQVSS